MTPFDRIQLQYNKIQQFVQKTPLLKHLLSIISKLLKISFSLGILLLGLEIIKIVLISGIDISFFQSFFDTPIRSFFISYIMTEITMAGSPVAGAFISLGESINLSIQNLTAIIMGTRGGVNSFLLILGLIMLLKGKSLRRALGITVIQFFVTLSVTLFTIVFVFPLLQVDMIANMAEYLGNNISIQSGFQGFISNLSTHIKNGVNNNFILIFIGIGALITGLFSFDKSFSFLKEEHNANILKRIESERTAFLAGLFITSLSMSLSVSVAIILPLYTKKLIHRKHIIAYILGANISTLLDTLLLALITRSVLGLQVIIAFFISVVLVVLIYMILFKYYMRVIEKIADTILDNKYYFIAFLIIVMLLPIIVLFV